MSHLMKTRSEDIAYLYLGADPQDLAARWIAAEARLIFVTRGEEE